MFLRIILPLVDKTTTDYPKHSQFAPSLSNNVYQAQLGKRTRVQSETRADKNCCRYKTTATNKSALQTHTVRILSEITRETTGKYVHLRRLYPTILHASYTSWHYLSLRMTSLTSRQYALPHRVNYTHTPHVLRKPLPYAKTHSHRNILFAPGNPGQLPTHLR